MTYLFCNWNFVPFIPLHLFHPSLHYLPLWQPSVCALNLWVYFCVYACFSVFLDSTYKWNHKGFFFLSDVLLSIPSGFIHIFANSKISLFFSFLFLLNNSHICVCVCIHVYIYTYINRWMDISHIIYNLLIYWYYI